MKSKTVKSEICNYINEKKIKYLLSEANRPDKKEINEIIDKSLSLNGLSPEEAACLLQVNDESLIDKYLKAARKVKEKIYGKRLVIFAPLYFANHCQNNCLYCGFRRDNEQIERQQLSQEEIKREVEALERTGHKRLLVLAGESKKCDLDYILESIDTAYNTTTGNSGEIRRINVEIAPLNTSDFKRLKEASIGTYTCFQETYHRPTYEKMHPSGPKADYEYRLSVMDRAQEAGIDDVGIGALFGLYDYRYEVLGLLLHTQYLDQKFGVGPHTISIPRINPALGAPISQPPNPVSDKDFRKLTAVLRLAVPYTGLILTTRESVKLRNELFLHGVSQISAGSRTTPGGYKNNENREQKREQFSLHDTRPLQEIIIEIARQNYIPSFCTACYRLGRTGQDFMDLAKPGKIQKFCQPNAMMTFQEYLMDYGSKQEKDTGTECLQYHIEKISENNKPLAQKTKKKLNKIVEGERDLYV